MNHKFDEPAERLAQSVTGWQALNKFSLGLVGLALAGGLSLPARAQVSHLGPLVELSQPNPVGTCDTGFWVPGTWND